MSCGALLRWPIEVKAAELRAADLRDLLEFVRRYRGFRPLLITGHRGAPAAAEVSVPTMTWRRFLVDGPPR